ncbi:MAG: LysR family transcriptional regulator [Hyphomicrobiaceae bacterium]|nr:LysR family transcriptional regulator [Hyphomicrobiaceae bacterium]
MRQSGPAGARGSEEPTGQVEPAPLDGSRPSLKLQIDLPGGCRIGPGKIRLLTLIETEGSLSKAAETMGVSYRRAWLFVQQINAAFREPAVATPQHGHGGAAARLTPFGRELIARYTGLAQLAELQGAGVIDWLEAHEKSQ